MRNPAVVMLGIVLSIVLNACEGRAPGPRTEIVVSAAASLADALKELQADFEAKNPDVTLRFNFGSSGALAQQIAQGAPVDLFISAAPEPMASLVEQGVVAPGAVQTLARNRVVLIRPAAGEVAVGSWADLGSGQAGKIALGNPQHVPAGQYGEAVLEYLGLWAGVEPRLVLAEDVRQVLHYVESGEVAAGIVYSSDAARSDKVSLVAEAPAGSHPPVEYPMAVVHGARHRDEARRFAEYLSGATGREVLKKYGFTVEDGR